MIIRKSIDFSDPLTPEQQNMLKELESRPICPDEDCPEFTPEEMTKFAEAARKRRQRMQNKQTVTIRLSPQALDKARSLGKGYTSVLSRILESALADNETIRHYL